MKILIELIKYANEVSPGITIENRNDFIDKFEWIVHKFETRQTLIEKQDEVRVI